MNFKKKSIGILLFIFICCFDLFSLDFFHIDLNTEFGLEKGEINEYVVYTPSSDEKYILSRIDWDLDFIRFVGVSADIVLFEHLYFGASGRFGFPSASGYMQDYDWLNVINYPEYDWLTNYSKHENQLTNYLDGTIKIGGIINLPLDFFLMPSISLQGQEFAFSGYNGYIQYARNSNNPFFASGVISEWNEEIPKQSISGKVISYNQQRLFLFAGLKAYTTIVPRMRFEIEGNLCPYTMIGAIDNHCIRKIYYLDQPRGFGTWSVAGRIQFSFSRFCRLALNVDYQQVPFLVGANFSKPENGKTWNVESNYLGGASSKVFSFSLMATLYF